MVDLGQFGLEERLGTSGVDDLRAEIEVVVFGLQGNDTLRGFPYLDSDPDSDVVQDPYLAGGSGADTYLIEAGEYSVVVDGLRSPGDRVWMPDSSIDLTFFYEIGGVLVGLDFVTGAMALVDSWLDKERGIERIELNDWVADIAADGAKSVRKSDSYLGKVSWDEVDEVLPSGQSDMVRATLAAVGARADELEGENGGLPPAVVDPPTANDDAFTVEALEVGKKGVPLDILDNDVAATGSLDPKSVTLVDLPEEGTVTVKKGQVLYKPNTGFEGEDNFTYTVEDRSGLASDPANVIVQVNQPAAPLALADLLDEALAVSEPAEQAVVAASFAGLAAADVDTLVLSAEVA